MKEWYEDECKNRKNKKGNMKHKEMKNEKQKTKCENQNEKRNKKITITVCYKDTKRRIHFH